MRLDQLEAVLSQWEAEGLLRVPDVDSVRQQLQKEFGGSFLDLSSNDYLGLRRANGCGADWQGEPDQGRDRSRERSILKEGTQRREEWPPGAAPGSRRESAKNGGGGVQSVSRLGGGADPVFPAEPPSASAQDVARETPPAAPPPDRSRERSTLKGGTSPTDERSPAAVLDPLQRSAKAGADSVQSLDGLASLGAGNLVKGSQGVGGVENSGVARETPPATDPPAFLDVGDLVTAARGVGRGAENSDGVARETAVLRAKQNAPADSGHRRRESIPPEVVMRPGGRVAQDSLPLGAAVSRETVAPAGAGASRLIFGTHPLHLEVEQLVAEWLRRPAALLFGSGYAANLGALGCLLSAEDCVISDSLNHASLIDGIRLSPARPTIVPHLSLSEIEKALLAGRSAPSRWVVLESYYSMDGDSPPLQAVRELCDRHDAFLYLDEAHAFGTFGPEGAGLAAAAGIVPDVLMVAFGKAVGSQGACVVGSESLRTFLWNRARSFVFSTAPSPLLVGSLRDQLKRTRRADGQRAELQNRVQRFREGAARRGVTLVPGSFGPICSITVGEAERSLRVANQLRRLGILAQAIRPPTVPAGGSRVRLTLRADLAEDGIECALDALGALLGRS